MEILSLLIPLALILGTSFIGLFIWATKNGQFDDLDTPSKRILLNDNNTKKNNSANMERKNYEC